MSEGGFGLRILELKRDLKAYLSSPEADYDAYAAKYMEFTQDLVGFACQSFEHNAQVVHNKKVYRA